MINNNLKKKIKRKFIQNKQHMVKEMKINKNYQ